MGYSYPKEKRDAVLADVDSGLSLRATAKKREITVVTIRKWIKKRNEKAKNPNELLREIAGGSIDAIKLHEANIEIRRLKNIIRLLIGDASSS